MRGRPLVPHCPSCSCRDQLARYRMGVSHTRPEVPVEVPNAPTKRVRRNRRVVTLTLLHCPTCGYEFYSTTND